MEVLSWIIFGLLAGVVTSLLDSNPTPSRLVGTVIIGIAGSVVGGMTANLVLGLNLAEINFQSMAVAALGALVILLGNRAFSSKN